MRPRSPPNFFCSSRAWSRCASVMALWRKSSSASVMRVWAAMQAALRNPGPEVHYPPSVLSRPIQPMLAKLATELPQGEGWLYEPKWDGFRALVFRDGDDVHLQSRDLKPLNRYFPELIEPLRARLPARCVLDGEIVIAGAKGLDFDALLLRIHPAASRIQVLAAQTPASYVAFDLPALDEDLRARPQEERRALLERAL